MDQFPEVPQILTIAGLNIESITALAVRASRTTRWQSWSAGTRTGSSRRARSCRNDVAAVAEAERALTTLGFRGIEVSNDINGRPLDAPELARIAFGCVLERFSGAEDHHAPCRRADPFFHKRIELSWDFNRDRMGTRTMALH